MPLNGENPVPEASVNLHIGQLSLEGVAPAARNAVARSLEAELVRLFSEEGVPAGLVTGRGEIVPRALEAYPTDPSALGRAVARSLYEGFR